MALELIKLNLLATTSVNTTPTNSKFFYKTIAETAAGGTLTIDAADFLLDDGQSATELPVLATDNSYFMVYINGVLQMNGILTYTPGITAVGSLAIDVPAGGESIINNSSIILEVVNYAPSATTTVVS